MPNAFLPTLAVTLALIAPTGARAGEEIKGAFVLEAIPLDGSAYPDNRTCLMARINRVRPALVNSGDDGICGLPSNGPIVALIWDITPVAEGNGRVAYQFRNRGNGKCLVRGERYPILDRCDSPRAKWSFDEVDAAPERHITALRNGPAMFLSFENGTTGSASFTDHPDVSTMFRLTPVSTRPGAYAKKHDRDQAIELAEHAPKATCIGSQQGADECMEVTRAP